MMHSFKKIVLGLLAIFLVSLSGTGISAQPSISQQPKNIIVLFADGVTGSQWEFGRKTSELIRQKPF